MEKLLVLSLFSFLLTFDGTTSSDPSSTTAKKVKIAIIGGGVNGALTSYYLHRLLKDTIDKIDIYEDEETSDKLVMRTLLVHSQDKYINQIIAKKPELKLSKLFENKFCVVNDKKIDLLSIDSLKNKDKSAYRKLSKFIKNSLEKFQKIYRLQKSKKSYANLTDLLHDLDPKFDEYLEISTNDLIDQEMTKNQDLKTFLEAILVRKHQKKLNAHAFVGLENFWSSEITGELATISNGLNDVVKALSDENDHIFKRKVLSVTRRKDPNLRNVILSVTGPDDITGGEASYDLVIFAEPNIEKINFFGYTTRMHTCNYSRTYITVVEGELKKTYFEPKFGNYKDISCIINPKNVQAIEEWKTRPGRWDVLSQMKLKKADIGKIFEENYKILQKNIVGRETPKYFSYNCARKISFVLAENLYNVNAIDWAAVSLEMTAISAKNVALLIKQKIGA